MAGRRPARRAALALLYRWDVMDEPPESLQAADEEDPFARELAESVVARADELDARIDAASHTWTADRLGAIERNVLRMGIYELQSASVPREVAISEAVKLAKRYATPEAARLVNGILDRIARDEDAARSATGDG